MDSVGQWLREHGFRRRHFVRKRIQRIPRRGHVFCEGPGHVHPDENAARAHVRPPGCAVAARSAAPKRQHGHPLTGLQAPIVRILHERS